MNKTWFIDFDGTLVAQKSHMADEDYILPGTKDFFKKIDNDDFIIITTARKEEHKKRLEEFFKKNDIRFDLIICGLPTGKRIVVNDKKPDGALTAYSFNLERDVGVNSIIFENLNE